jgi:hypothetical protein
MKDSQVRKLGTGKYRYRELVKFFVVFNHNDFKRKLINFCLLGPFKILKVTVAFKFSEIAGSCWS